MSYPVMPSHHIRTQYVGVNHCTLFTSVTKMTHLKPRRMNVRCNKHVHINVKRIFLVR